MRRNDSIPVLLRDAFLAAGLLCVILSGLAQARMMSHGVSASIISGLTIRCMDDAGIPDQVPGKTDHCDQCTPPAGQPLPEAGFHILLPAYILSRTDIGCANVFVPAFSRTSLRSRGPPEVI